MGELRCVDGSILSVTAVACRDRAGHAYEITLELSRDSIPFAAVGERCGHQLARLADSVRDARRDPEQAAMWPDPDDRFPGPARRHDYCPGDDEVFSLRARDRGDLPGSGELRCTLRSSADWVDECAGVGGPQVPRQRAWPGRCYWQLTRRAVVEAWGGGGIGVRAVLTSAELVRFLDTVLTEPDGSVPAESAPVGELTMSEHLGEAASPVSRQRGSARRVPDGSARSRLPALRAQARGVLVAERDPSSCRGDVRR